jgi:hypothetical protein
MTNPQATDKQRKYIWVLCQQTQSQVPFNLDHLTKAEANSHIGRLKLKKAEREHKQALRLKKAKQQRRARERAQRAERGGPTLRPGVRRGARAIREAAEPWTVADDPVSDLDP